MAVRIQEGTSGLGYLNPWNYEAGISEGIGDFLAGGQYRDEQGGSSIGNLQGGSFPTDGGKVAGATQEQNQSYDMSQYNSPAGPTQAPTQTSGNRTAAPVPSGFDRFDKGNDPGEGWGWHGPDGGWKPEGGSGGGGDFSQQISDIYAPALRAADEQEGLARSGKDADEKNLLARISKSLSDYGTQGENLLSGTQGEQTKFNSVIESALNQAVRAYKALAQRARGYGGGNSASRALGELAQKEFARQQGKIGQRNVEGTKEFGLERTKISQYVDSKKKDLDLFKQESLTSLKNNLDQTIASINARRGEIESNKTRDKVAALQQAINRTQAIQDQDRQVRQNLGLAAVDRMQEISGRTFSPNEIKAYMSEFTSDFNVTPGQPTQANSLVAGLNTKPQTYEDEFANLNPIAQQQTQGPQIGPQSTESGPYIPNGFDQQGNYLG